MTKCITNFPVDNWSYYGYLGFTARNHFEARKGKNYPTIDVRKIKVLNTDDRYYQTEISHIDNTQSNEDLNSEIEMKKKQEEEANDEIFTSTRNLGAQAEDLIAKIKEKEGVRFQPKKQDIVQLTKEDSKEETLYKMFEMVKHINWSLSHLLKREDGLYKMLKQSENLPQII